jgi:hypothetical protein
MQERFLGMNNGKGMNNETIRGALGIINDT